MSQIFRDINIRTNRIHIYLNHGNVSSPQQSETAQTNTTNNLTEQTNPQTRIPSLSTILGIDPMQQNTQNDFFSRMVSDLLGQVNTGNVGDGGSVQVSYRVGNTNQTENRPSSLHDVLQHTKCSVYKTTNESSENENEKTCVICHNAFVNDDIIREINHCNHTFHMRCLDQWLEKSQTCPLCRKNIVENPETRNNDEVHIMLEDFD